jgi:protein PhnA
MALQARAGGVCELCGSAADLAVRTVPPGDEPEQAVLVCSTCAPQLDDPDELEPNHWHCLSGAMWSQVPAVQVLSWRLLQRLRDHGWAQDLADQLYLDDTLLAWARHGHDEDGPVQTVDSNGTPLNDGDSITLTKDLDVKGTSFVAKRGTTVKGIRLADDPGYVEGRVNKVAILIKTEFTKRVG